MLVDVECPNCNGMGEVCGVNPNRRSRFVGMDDLSPDDYTIQCPECLGSGLVEHDLEADIEEWMIMTPRPRQAALAERPYRQAALALMSHPPLPEEPKPFGHRQWINPAPISMRKRG